MEAAELEEAIRVSIQSDHSNWWSDTWVAGLAQQPQREGFTLLSAPYGDMPAALLVDVAVGWSGDNIPVSYN